MLRLSIVPDSPARLLRPLLRRKEPRLRAGSGNGRPPALDQREVQALAGLERLSRAIVIMLTRTDFPELACAALRDTSMHPTIFHRRDP